MKKEKGITLIALIVTIIILIILAGVSISMLIGENGLLTVAKTLDERQQIVTWAEKLELYKAPVAIENKGEVTIEAYINYVEDKENIKETDLEKIDEFQYYITVGDKFVFLLQQVDNQDVKITYVGNPMNMPPRIMSMEMSSNSNSITVKVNTIRSEGGEYAYYIKDLDEEEYGEAKSKSQNSEYTFENLEQNHIYSIKVLISTQHGSSEKEDSKTTGVIEALTLENTNFIFTPEGWTNEEVKTKIETAITGYTLQYSKDLKKWENYTEEIISNKNETIYARLTDGNNIGDYVECQITNIDSTAPKDVVFTLSGKGTVEDVPILKAGIKHIDAESGIDIENSKWVLTTLSTEIGEDASKYTGGNFLSNNQEISITLQNEGEYYLHILSVDNAGNAKESISQKISMTKNRHKHIGDKEGGGCYTTPVYHKHFGNIITGEGCYTTPVYHQHIGNEIEGGSCYTTPILHEHSNTCYTTQTCVLTLINTYTNRFGGVRCSHCGSTNTQTHTYYVYSHSLCGSGNTTYEEWFCYGACGGKNTSGSNQNHSVTVRTCNKDEGTIEGYKLSCEKTEQTIDSYTLGCGKTEDVTIDSYALGCGLEENQVISYTITY